MDVKTQKKLDHLEETKHLIREAIEEKGQTVTDSDSFRSYADKIASIETGADVSVVTATAPHVLAGDVFVDAQGNPVEGTMPNRGNVRKQLDTAQANFVLSAGYYTGGNVYLLNDRKDATPTKEEQIIRPDSGRVLSQVTVAPIPDQYQDVTPVTATAEDVRAGKVFVDAEGNAVEGALSGTIADVSGVTATAANVLQGKTIVDADGNEVEGSIPVVETSEVELTVQTPSGAIPVGYYANGVALSVAAKRAAVTPTKETQNLADSFYDSITIDPIPEEYQNVSGVTATAEDVVAGKVIVDAQGNEVVGTLVPGGGGGGSLPAGLYWQDDRINMPPPTNFNHKLFVFNGEIYAIANTSSDSKTKNVRKLANGAWTTVTSYNFALAYTPFTCIAFNGEMHLFASQYHFSFDGSTVKAYASLKDQTGYYRADNGLFVEDGKLKFYSESVTYVFAWDEATDTWTQEYEHEMGTSPYAKFLNYNNKIYCVKNKNVYEYDHGTLTQIGAFSNSTWMLLFHDDHLYNLSDGGTVYKLSLATGTDTLLGYVPKVYGGTGSMDNDCVVVNGQIHFYSGGYTSGNGFSASNLIMHEVTE